MLEAPALTRVQHERGAKGVEVVAINILPEQAPFATWKAFWRAAGGGPGVRLAEDPAGRAAAAFNVRSIGTTIVLDRQGRIVYRDAGATAYETLRAAVDEAL
ncbi:MAG TPA: TlpA disulfide reductase family protein [Thermodesulfobacteriota bacterium]|nr:TlpA disulfide reductase family protein [Thermodesulfobacteriota bacterium]